MLTVNINTSRLPKYPLMAYIFFISWSGAFALNELFRFHYIAGLVALSISAVAVAYRGQFSTAPYKLEDIWIILFLATYFLSALLNPHISSVNYVTVYIFVIIGLYLATKGAFYLFLTSREIYLSNLAGISFVCLFLVLNFLFTITDIIDLQSMVPRLRATTATYARVFVRGYGFSTEPGIVAYYINTLGPLALWYLWSHIQVNRFIKILLTCIITFGWVLTFSAGGLAAMSLSFIFITILFGVKTNWKTFKNTQASTVICIFFGVVSGAAIIIGLGYYKYFTPLFYKLTLTGGFKSVSTRIERFTAGIESLKYNLLFGNGPGFFSSDAAVSPINWYLMVLSESGVISFIFIFIFLMAVLKTIIAYQHPSRFSILIGFVAACCHLMVTTTAGYLHPFIWLLIAIFYSQMALANQTIRQKETGL